MLGRWMCFSGLPPGETRRCRVRDRRRAAGCDDAEFGAGELAEPRADGVHQLVQLHHPPGRFRLRGLDDGQLERSAVDRQCAGAVDERAHADRLVDVRPDLERADHRRRCGRGGRRLGRSGPDPLAKQERGKREETASPEQVAPSQPGRRLLERLNQRTRHKLLFLCVSVRRAQSLARDGPSFKRIIGLCEIIGLLTTDGPQVRRVRRVRQVQGTRWRRPSLFILNSKMARRAGSADPSYLSYPSYLFFASHRRSFRDPATGSPCRRGWPLDRRRSGPAS